MTVIKRRLHFIPTSDVSRKFHLIWQRKDMLIICYIDMQHMEAIFFAQVIGQIDEAC